MKKVRLFILGVPLVLVVFCTLPSDYFLEKYPDYYQIDAVTSSSFDVQIKDGIAYDTFAIMETYHKDSYDKHFVAYGLRDSIYTDTVYIIDFPWTQICTLSNLYPNVDYYYILRGELKSNPEKENHTVQGTFRTVPR